MRFESMQYSQMQLLRTGPHWDSLQRPPEPMGAPQGKPGEHGTQNFGWVGYNAFGHTSKLLACIFVDSFR